MKNNLLEESKNESLSNGMRILIVTPLYPPDIAGSALYVKELATRLSARHSVTILTYGHLPEAIPNVHIVSVEKSQPLLTRLVHFTRACMREQAEADVVLVENGPSVELPLFLTCLSRKANMLFHLYDETALCHATTSYQYRLPFLLARWCATHLMVHRESRYSTHLVKKADSRLTTLTRPLARPEILPLESYPEAPMADYKKSWENHLAELTTLFTKI